MKASEAKIIGIPLLTKTEQLDSDASTVKDIFKDEDVSGLDLQFKRSKKVNVNCIEDYLRTLEVKEDEDGECSEELSLPDSPKGFFKKNYKMVIAEKEEQESATKELAASAFKSAVQMHSASTRSKSKKVEDS